MVDENVFPPTVKQLGDPRGQDATWTMLPVEIKDGRCTQCGMDHAPEEPHNPQSLAYQYSFYAEYGRWPGWLDAMAHCTPELQKRWKAALRERGVELKEEAASCNRCGSYSHTSCPVAPWETQ